MNEIRVSVSITTYNHEKYIQDCLQSVIDQECNFNFEIVVAEDCSTDETRKIVNRFSEEYPNIIKLIYQKQNVGLYKNTLDVLNACSSKYIATLDGDDCMLPGRLQKEFDFLECNQDVAMVFHNMQIIGENINENTFNNSLHEKGSVINLEDFVNGGLAHWGCSSKMYRRNCLPAEGISCNLKCIEDQHFHLQIARNGKIAYIPEVLGLYRKHKSGLSQLNKKNIECAVADLVFTYSDALRFGVTRKTVDKRLSFIFYDAACQYLMLKDYIKFKHYITKSYENLIFFNTKHRIFFILKDFPRALFLLKTLNNYVYSIRGKQII